MKRMLLLWLCVCVWFVHVAAETYVADEEFIGPFSTWTNIKTSYGAVGNGIADDTTAFRNAFADLGTSGHASVLYIPAGTYLLTEATGIQLFGKIYVAVIGEDPATTIIKYTGASTNHSLFYLNGTRYSRISRLTIDGNNGTDITCIYQGWDGTTTGNKNFDTGNEYSDMVLTRCAKGIWGGGDGFGFAEVSIVRSTFSQNVYGVALGNFNAKDVYIWHCLFDSNQRSISNVLGAGEFRAYKNVFRNSSIADMEVFNTGVFSARQNFSSGSAKFFVGGNISALATITLQGNTIINPGATEVITIGSQALTLIYDNIFRSSSGASTGPVIRTTQATVGVDTVTVGNTYTVSSAVSAAGRSLAFDETQVTFASLNPTEPTLPATPTNQGRTIVEVTSGSNTATIQGAINTAASSGTKSVVHIQPGTYQITAPLMIPANATLQVVGDTLGVSILHWNGGSGGPLIHIRGPSQAIVKDLFLDGAATVNAINTDTIDQPGSRVALRQMQFRDAYTTKMTIEALAHTAVDLRDAGFAGINVHTPISLDVNGARNVKLWSGASSTSVLSYNVRSGGNLLVRDMWYETSASTLPNFVNFVNTNGTFTLESSRVALPANQATPAIQLSGFQGRATFLTTKLDDRIVTTGSGTDTQVLGLGMQGPLASVVDPYFVNTSSPTADARLLNSRRSVASGSGLVADIGANDAAFVRSMLAQTRNALMPELSPVSADVTDIRLVRLWMHEVMTGVKLLANSTLSYILDNAIHPPPDCGPYDYEDFTPAAANFPAVGGTFTDPVFGATVTRLSNIYPSTSGSPILYGINGRWNADSTAFLHKTPTNGVDNATVINPATGAVIRSSAPYDDDGEVSFDPVNADIYYYTNGNILSQYSVSGNSSSTTKDFGAALGGLGQSNDWIDKTGDIFLLNIAGNFRIWKKSTDTLYTGSVSVSTNRGGSGWIGLSPDGNYVISSNSDSPFEKRSWAVNHGTTTLSTSGVLFWDAINTDHADIVSTTDGNTYLITGQNVHSFQGSTRHYFRVLVTNAITAGSSTQLTATGNQMLLPILAGNTAGNGDFACGAKGTYQDWCYANVADPADLLGNPGTWYQYKSELMLIHMLPPFEVRRLMHHRARPHRGFCRQVRESANWDGTKIIFSSPFSATDSADCGYSDIYRYDAP